MNVAARTRPVAVATAVLAITIAGLIAAPAPAAPSWRPATALSAPLQDAHYSTVVVDADGASTAVWSIRVGGTYVVQSATRPAGDAWLPPEPVASGVDPDVPLDLAVDPAGNLTATWVGQGAKATMVRVSQRPAGGSWTAAQDISWGGDSLEPPRVGVDAQGTATVVWSEAVNGTETVYVSSRTAGQAWTDPKPLAGDEGVVLSPDIAVNASGEAVVGWYSGSFGFRSRLRSAAGAWGTVETFPGELPGEKLVDVAITDSGVASYASTYQPVGANLNVAVAEHPRGQRWSAPRPFCAATTYCTFPRFAANEAGDAVLLWRSEHASDTDVLISTRTPDGVWSTPRTLDTEVDFDFDLRVVLDPAGAATAFWTSGVDTSPNHAQPVVFARHPRNGDWSDRTWLADPDVNAYDPAVAVSPTGDITATWTSDLTTIQAAGLDVAGPRLDGFSAPATAAPGEQLGFAAAASDAWSPVTSYAWSFGDGSTATGAAVTHTYAAPGSYPVTLTVTDKVGNTTTRTATTTVAAAVSPPAGKKTPEFTVFRLSGKTVAALRRSAADPPERTKLKIGLNTAAKVRLVVKSVHRHLVDGKRTHVKVVLTRQLPAGHGAIALRGRLAAIKLAPDTYTITGTATNSVGTSPKKQVRLRVVREPRSAGTAS